MRTTLVSLLANRYVVFTGWTLLMVLWETTVVGLLLAVWRLTQHGTSARRQYNAAMTAFVAASVLAVLTPVVLSAVPTGPSPSLQRRPPDGPQASQIQRNSVETPAAFATGETAAVPSADWMTPDRAASAAALLWILGVVTLGARLIGGWVLTQRIVREAQLFDLPYVIEAIEPLRDELPFGRDIPVLQSASVDAPVVVGWRRPVLILPDEAASLTSETLVPLLAHELAHVRRRDYIANLCQSIIDVLLFFSPAVMWMSRRTREAREFCCDDVAVTRCGDVKHYVRALTTLAALGGLNTTGPALSAAGPRLITRVRRLLQEESMHKLGSVRIAASISLVVALLSVGTRVSTASAARAPRGGVSRAVALEDNVPYGWQSEPEGAGITLEHFVSTAEAPASSVTVRNISTAPVTGVQFLAAVEQLGGVRFMRPPVRLFASKLLPVSIAPGQSVAVSPQVLSAEQLQQVAADAGGVRIQFFFGVQRVKFANGEWSITVNPTATSGSDAFNIRRRTSSTRAAIERLVYSRDLITRDAGAVEVPFRACRDDRNRATSHGGMVAILSEPGKFMRCQNGRWVESAGR